MSIPLTQRLKEQFPKAKIILITKKDLLAVWKMVPFVDQIWLWSNKFETLQMFSRRLKKENIDVSILLGTNKDAACGAHFLAEIPMRIGYDFLDRKIFLTHFIPTEGFPYEPKLTRSHLSDNYLQLLKFISVVPKHVNPQLLLGRTQILEAKKKIKKIGLTDQHHIIGVAPGAGYGPAKQWPWRSYKILIEKLMSRPDTKAILFGSTKDLIASRSAFNSLTDGVVNLIGKTTLEEAIQLISQCHVFLSNDSGLAHVATALGIPTLTLFGSTNPVWTRPQGEHSKIIRIPLPCSPCYQSQCPLGHTKCLKDISVDHVFKQYLDFIG